MLSIDELVKLLNELKQINKNYTISSEGCDFVIINQNKVIGYIDINNKQLIFI